MSKIDFGIVREYYKWYNSEVDKRRRGNKPDISHMDIVKWACAYQIAKDAEICENIDEFYNRDAPIDTTLGTNDWSVAILNQEDKE